MSRRKARYGSSRRVPLLVYLGLWVSFATLLGASPALASEGHEQASASHHAQVSRSHMRRRRRGRLRVVVKALPHTLKSDIVVSGPHKERRAVSHSRVLRLSPGRYRIKVMPVQASTGTSTGTYYASVSHLRERVRAGRTRVVSISYGTFVPSTTHTVSPAETVSLTGAPTGLRTLTLTGAAAASAAVGQFLASGPSAADPDGYLVKVVSVEHNGETAVLQVENATLLEAVPQGEINEEETLTPTAGAASLPLSRALALGRFQRGGPIAHEAWEKEVHLDRADLECDASAKAVITPRFSFSGPTLALHAHWGWFLKLKSASLTVSMGEKASLTATGTAGASCKLKDPIALLPHAIKLPKITFTVGVVPVVITPSIQIYLDADASIKAKVTASLAEEAKAKVGVSYEKGSFHPIKSFEHRFTPSLDAEGDADAEASLLPTLSMLVYGAAGPTVDIGVAAKVEANTTRKPWWKLKGCLQAGVGIELTLLKWSWEDPHLLNVCKTLLSAKGGFHESAGSGETGKKEHTSKSKGSGGGEGGGLCKRYETVGFETKCAET